MNAISGPYMQGVYIKVPIKSNYSLLQILLVIKSCLEPHDTVGFLTVRFMSKHKVLI